MKDLTIILRDEPGTLAKMGEVLGAAGVSLEGGGVFVHQGTGVAHFLVENPAAAKHALERHNITVSEINPVLIQKLKQDVPGQLGKISRMMADHGINIVVQYSDHSNQLILVVDDFEKGQQISKQWSDELDNP